MSCLLFLINVNQISKKFGFLWENPFKAVSKNEESEYERNSTWPTW